MKKLLSLLTAATMLTSSLCIAGAVWAEENDGDWTITKTISDYTSITGAEAGCMFGDGWANPDGAKANYELTAEEEGVKLLKMAYDKSTKASAGIAYDLSSQNKTVSSGKLRVTQEIKLEKTDTSPRVLFELVGGGMEDDSTTVYRLGALSAETSGKFGYNGDAGGNNYTSFAGYAVDTWYTVIQTYDFDKQKYDVQILDGDQVIAAVMGVELKGQQPGKLTNEKYLKDGRKINYRVQSGAMYLRKLTVEHVTGTDEYGEGKGKLYTEDDFEGFSKEGVQLDNTVKNSGWKLDNATQTSAPNYDFPVTFSKKSDEDSHKISAKLEKNRSGMQRTFGHITSGKVKVSYSVFTDGGDIMVDAGAQTENVDNKSTSHYINLIYIRGANAYHTKYTVTSDLKLNVDLETSGWINVSNVIDLSGKKNTIYVNEKRIATVDLKSANSNSDAWITEMNSIRFRNWTSSDKEVYVDDVRVEEYVPKPTINDASVVLVDSDNNEISGKENITPAIGAIKLDFDCSPNELNADTLNITNIELKKQGGDTAVTYTDDKTDNYFYIIKPNTFLEPNSTYTLTVKADVANNEGQTLGSDFTYTFTTNAGECKAVIGELKVNEQKVENLSALTAGDTLKVEAKYTNSTAANKNLVVIVVYFDKDETMLQTNSVSKTAAASKGSTETAEFTIPDMSKVETVKVFLWDDWSNMNPYCAPVVKKAAESPSPSV